MLYNHYLLAKAFAVLFMANSERDNLPYSHLEVIDFMIDILIETVFK